MATEGAEKNLQGQDEAVEETVDTQAENTEEETEVERIEMTREELDAEKQREADRRVNQAKKKWEAEFKQTLEKEKAEARKEAEELAKLSAAERAKVEKEKEELRIDKERQELKEQRAEFEREKLLLETEKQLTQRKLPGDFAPYVIGGDAEDTLERMTVFEEQWRQAIETEIQERLKSKSPKAGAKKQGHYTRDQVEKMSQDEVAANMEAIEESMQHW